MDFLNGLSDFVSGALSVFSKVVDVASNIAETLSPTLKNAISVIKGLTIVGSSLIGGLVDGIAKAFNLINKTDNLDEFSYKATKTEKDMSDFDKFDDYIDYLREQPLDEDGFKNRSKEEFLATKGASTVIVSKGLSEKIGMNVTPEFFTMMANNKMNPKEVISIINTFKNSGVVLNVVDYVNNKLDNNLDEKIQSSNLLEKALTEANPNLDENQIADKMLILDGDKLSLEKATPEDQLDSFEKEYETVQAKINATKLEIDS